ncbi:MAG TPA: pyridoxal-phosphate dependent enzyme, partial [Acidimicrobiales bacterium]|nr:pyridoxal-phosphate dependent enzyme [Acidimicrobiales bacterium]
MPEPAQLTATAVAAAAEVLRPVVRQTPVERSERLSLELGTEVWLKREDLQIGRSYKVRGAYNLISSLTPDERRLGVTCASAGNHAQGVAYSCRMLGIHGKVFVPTTTPRQKRQRIVAIGRPWVDLVLAGSNYDEASAAALDDAATTGSVYVHPFDDVRTIAGQGTVGVELHEQCGPGMGTVI